ncbi:MAG: phosphoenolpyruvate--protein phosphotransferase [Candidatus Saelkia tenebricola]|nr:phosphoenolpyruvate--protein phosphotransferase [Candidatus Saelkia tenebricola]
MFKKEQIIKGVSASPGIAIGKAYVISDDVFKVEKRIIKDADLSEEIKNLETALLKTKREIVDIQSKMAKEMGSNYADIFDVQLMLLEDRVLLEEIIERLRKELLGVEYIFFDVLKKYKRALEKLNDPYLKERAQDVNDFGKRVLKNLTGKDASHIKELRNKAIIVTHDLSPSEAAVLNPEYVLGLVTESGGSTTHTAIMAKSFEIPAVVGTGSIIMGNIEMDDSLIIDGSRGIIIVNPHQATLKEYEAKKNKVDEKFLNLLKFKDLKSQTKDGVSIKIMANIELSHEVKSAINHGADGIGLYRTEYLYLNRSDLPSEEEQYQAYKLVTLQMASHIVIIRTLDLGGDKLVSQLDMSYELNPFLGWRAIRFCLARPAIFKVQLRAILRASVHGNLQIMFPMISSIEEMEEALKIVDEVMQDLDKEEIPHNKDVKIGAMIETPSVAMTCDHFKGKADFFSIGTNDLIQYTIAVDRINEKIAYLYDPAHPGVLRLIENIIQKSSENNIPVGMCGEMAGETIYLPLLLGLGLRYFSVSPLIIPELKLVASSLTLDQAKEIAREVMSFSSREKIRQYLSLKLKEILGSDYEELIEV